MKPYSFFKHDGRSVTPVFELGDFADDRAARAHAEWLLKDGPKYKAIEVWDGVNEPFTVERRRPEAASSDHRASL